MAFCAVSDTPVGIDAEKNRPFKKRDKYHFFSENENTYVNSSSNTNLSFLEIWTRKEALFKCSGISSSELSAVSVMSDFDGYSFKTEFFDGYIISICLKK
jgi:phosphopantetheinyl transferase